MVHEEARGSAGSRPWGPEYIFAALLAVFGLFFVFGIPPGQGTDEPSHFPRAYHISEGHLFPAKQDNCDWGCASLPVSVQNIIGAFFTVGNRPDLQVKTPTFFDLAAMPLEPERRLTVIYPTASHYTFVPYLPSSTAIALARAAGLGPLPMFYAGRLASLLVGVLAVFWAIRLVPRCKLVFGMTVLIPISVQQFSMYSPDGSTLSAAFLLTALLLRLALEPGPRVGKGTIAALIGLSVWLALCKFPYLVILLLYLAVPAARFGTRQRYLGVATGVAVALACCLPLIGHGKTYVPNRMNGNPQVAIDKQTDFVRDNPTRFVKIVAATVAVHGQLWINQLGHLGWLDTHVNTMALHLYLLMIVMMALAERSPPPVSVKLLALGSVVICFGLIVTSCYVCGCPVKCKLVYGPQGRYFLPLIPLALLALPNRAIRLQADPGLLRALAASSAAGMLVVAVVTFVRRYYFHTDLELRVAPVALLAGAAVVIVVTALAWRRYGLTEESEDLEADDREPALVHADRIWTDDGGFRRMSSSSAG